MLGLVGKKRGMAQIFGAKGDVVPVTVVETLPCTIVQIRTRARDGYEAVQLGSGVRRQSRLSKARMQHAARGGRPDYERLVEFRVEDGGVYQVGQELKVAEVFKAGDVVDVTGLTKGRGFSGVVRRHGFSGHRATHGTHESFRGPGAVGARSYPGRIWKGKRMAGQWGGVSRTIQNLVVVAVRAEENLLLVKGGLPGARGGDVMIRPAVKRRSK
jgi:large subunit ribosomal protein L3